MNTYKNNTKNTYSVQNVCRKLQVTTFNTFLYILLNYQKKKHKILDTNKCWFMVFSQMKEIKAKHVKLLK